MCGEQKASTRKGEAIIQGLNRLLDAYRWAGMRKGSGIHPEEGLKLARVHRIGLAHLLEFVVELFCDSPEPKNYLWQLSIFQQFDEDERGASVLTLGDRFEGSVDQLVNRTMPEAVRLRLDSLSSLVMRNPVQAAFLCWAWVDIELGSMYRQVRHELPPWQFRPKVDGLLGKKGIGQPQEI